MKIKMWCLIHKPKDRVIKVYSDGSYVVGFDTKKDLLKAIEVDGQYHIDSYEEVKKIEVNI